MLCSILSTIEPVHKLHSFIGEGKGIQKGKQILQRRGECQKLSYLRKNKLESRNSRNQCLKVP